MLRRPCFALRTLTWVASPSIERYRYQSRGVQIQSGRTNSLRSGSPALCSLNDLVSLAVPTGGCNLLLLGMVGGQGHA